MAAWTLSGASANETAMRPRLMEMEGTLHSIPCRLDSAPIDGRLSRVAGFSLHAGVACEAGERERLERLCRYLTRPAASGERLSLTPQGNIRYRLKKPCTGMTPRTWWSSRQILWPAWPPWVTDDIPPRF